MVVKKLILKNFRAYKDIVIDFDKHLNVIIGQNDIGKSTILEALDIFFGQDVIKIDISDWNKDKEESKILIGVEFVIDDDLEIIIDSTNPTNLKNEHLLNADNRLEILKEFEIKDGKLSKEKVFINAFYPTIFDTPLVNLKIKDLQDLLKKHSLKSKDDKKSAEIRTTLYDSLINVDTKFTLQKIDISKEDAKAIWEQLQKELPLYFLFQSDRANKDSDGDIQNPLKTATKKIVSDFEDEFLKIKNDLEAKLTVIGNETIEQMKNMGLEVANSLVPKVNHKSLDTLFSFTLESDDGIALNKRGSGFRRMVMLNYFRAEAERKTIEKNNKNVIYAIEEPETAQHPNHQKMLIEALIELSNKENHQIIITTHTPEIAKMVQHNSLLLISKDDCNNPVLIEEENKLKQISNTLGIHPFYNNKVVVCVEGEFDIKFLSNINQTIEEYKKIIDLEKEGISIIPLNGGNLKAWVERHYLKDSNIIEIHIYDSDLDSGKNSEQYKKQHDEINARDDLSCAFMTKKKELENYIHRSLIEKEFSIALEDIENYDIVDIPSLIKNKSTHKDEKIIKNILNGKLSKQITKEHLEELQAYEEIKSWFEKIRELAQ